MRMHHLLSLALLLVSTAVVTAETKITHGPILGRPGSDSMAVWARTNVAGRFKVVFGEADKDRWMQTPWVVTKLPDDNTGWIELKGLKPNTRYRYFVVGEGQKTGPGGQFKTLPDSKAVRDAKLNPRGLYNFKFEFACGNNQNPAHGSGYSLPAFQTMNERIADQVDFAILNGDWLYEEERDYPATKWLQQVNADEADTPHVVEHAPTVTGVWENYKLYLARGKPLAKWHRNVPNFFTFDDHEILNDIWGAGSPGLRDRRAVFRDIGVHAWYDYLGWANPTPFTQEAHFGTAKIRGGSDVLTDESADFTSLKWDQLSNLHIHWGTDTAGVNENELDGVGGHASAGTYDVVKVLDKHRLQISPAPKADGPVAYSIGRRSYFKRTFSNCDFFFLDTRSHRQMHNSKEPAKVGLSILGPAQQKWLFDGIRESKADFLFVVSSVNFMIPHVGGGKIREGDKDEAWTVFLDEREKLIDLLDKSGKKAFILTGDLHNSFAIKITDRVWEFGSGPHNSNNHWYTDEGDRPASGPFKYGPRACDIRWSTWYNNDVERPLLKHPIYTVVQVNNVFNNPKDPDGTPRWVAFERPQVVFQYYNGKTGDLLYAESIVAEAAKPK